MTKRRRKKKHKETWGGRHRKEIFGRNQDKEDEEVHDEDYDELLGMVRRSIVSDWPYSDENADEDMQIEEHEIYRNIDGTIHFQRRDDRRQGRC